MQEVAWSDKLVVAPFLTVALPQYLCNVDALSMCWRLLQGFFYNQFPVPKHGDTDLGTETDINLNQQLCYHGGYIPVALLVCATVDSTELSTV